MLERCYFLNRRVKREGITDKNGKELSSFRFINILKNVEWRYSAEYKFVDNKKKEETLVKLNYEPILEQELVDKVIVIRDKLKACQSRRGRKSHIYLLSGIILGKNEGSFSDCVGHSRKKDYRYYYNSNLRIRLCTDKGESLVEDKILNYFKDSSHLKNLVVKTMDTQRGKVNELNKELKSLTKKHDELVRQSDTLVDHMTRDGLSDQAIEALTKRLNDNEAHKIEIKGQINEVEEVKKPCMKKPDISIVEKRVGDYAQKFKKLDRSIKRTLIRQVFEKIEVLDKYSLKLHIKKAPEIGAFNKFQTKSCDEELNGGTSRI